MASNNNNSESMSIAVVIAVITFIGLFLYALAAFFAVVLTIVALSAWNKSLTLFGHTIHPHEARAFVRNGFVGMFMVPLFVVFAQALLEFQINEEYWPHVFIIGYALGCLGITAMLENAPPAPPMRDVNPRELAHQLAPPDEMPRADPFRFADWDDEDAR